jgi:hypothetical protein
MAYADAADSQAIVLVPVFWMFLAVLVTFVTTRLITRRIRSQASRQKSGGMVGDITLGGVHIHHQVFGILIMLAAGLGLIAITPQGTALNVNAAVFGVGVGLAFDEFALWLHLEDVYWTTEGRQSVDAIFCVLVFTGVLIGGADLLTGRVGSGTWWTSVFGLLIVLALSVVCMLKGKLITGVIGIIVQPLVIVGAIRLAKPNSWWARHRYVRRAKRRARAERRFGEAYQRRWNRLRDLVAGAPDAASEPRSVGE